ncbi:MAG: hypothetical protein JO316_25440 [Abitibacteriaceae bacterium]|nr:hypothetical protein [Abditibacteriaceae bacterium]
MDKAQTLYLSRRLLTAAQPNAAMEGLWLRYAPLIAAAERGVGPLARDSSMRDSSMRDSL